MLGKIENRPLRLLGVSVSRLEDVRRPQQESLFNGHLSGRDQWLESTSRLAKATESLDKLRKRHGRSIVMPASLIGRKPLRRGLGSVRRESKPAPKGQGEWTLESELPPE